MSPALFALSATQKVQRRRGEMAKTLLKRSEVPEADQWDIKSVFASDEVWDAELRETAAALESLSGYSGRLGESAAILLEALTARDKILSQVGRVYLYAGMQFAGDSTEQAYAARV